jgi:UDP-glucose 4-epimerase
LSLINRLIIIIRKMNLLNRRKILITGGSGFIGKHLINRLSNNDMEIFSFSQGDGINCLPSVKHIDGDLKDKQQVEKIVSENGFDYVVHLAALKERSSNPDAFPLFVENNLIGSMNLFLSLIGNSKIKRIVVLGTAEEYGNNAAPFEEEAREAPVSSYSFSKVCIAHLCGVFYRLYGFPFVLLRPTIAYGPGQNTDMFLPSLINCLLNDRQFEMTEGDQTRDFIYIDDLVDAILCSLNGRDSVGNIINIGSGSPLTIKEVALKTGSIMNKRNLVKLGMKEYRNNEIMHYSVDNSKAEKLLNWTPKISMDDGLKKTIEYYMKERI